MQPTKYLISIIVSITLAACGGGGDSSENTSTPVDNGTTPAPILKFTSENSGDIATAMMLMSEGVIDVSELIESEFLWFYHAPNGIYTRNCLKEGKVFWELNSESKTSNTGKLTFINCLIDEPHSFSVGSQPSVFNGEVEVKFEVVQYLDKLEYTSQNLIKNLEISMVSSELMITEYEESIGIPINFNLTSKIEQDWEDSSATNLQSSRKTKDVDVDSFSAPLFGSQSEQLKQGKLIQYESYTPNEHGFQYHSTITTQYKSEKYDYEGDLTAEIKGDELGQNNNYSQRGISGEFIIIVGEEQISSSFDNETITVNSTSGFVGQALTYQILEDINFRLLDNNIMYLDLQKRTPFIFLGAERNTKSDFDADEYISFIFNKHLSNDRGATRSYILPLNWPIDNGEIEGNKLTISMKYIESIMATYNIDDIDLLTLSYSAKAKRIQPWQNTEGVTAFVADNKGSILELDDAVYNISSLTDSNELLGIKTYRDTSTFMRFDELGNKIEEKLLEPRLTDICVDQSAGKVYATQYDADISGKLQLSIFDDNFNIESKLDLNLGHDGNMVCNRTSLFFHDKSNDDSGVSYFKFDNQKLVETLSYDFNHNYISNDLTLNPMNENQVFSLLRSSYEVSPGTYDGDYQRGLKVEVLDFEFSPVNVTILDIDESQMYFYDEGSEHYNFEFPMFTDEVNNTLSFYNLVVDLENDNQVLHQFTQTGVFDKIEYVRYINSENRLIVTTYSVYDADDYTKLFDLPYIDRSITADQWFVDSQGRLNILLLNYRDIGNGIDKGQSIIYRTPVLRQ